MLYGKYDVSVKCGKSRKYDIYVQCFYENVVFHAMKGSFSLQERFYETILQDICDQFVVSQFAKLIGKGSFICKSF